MNQSHSIPPFKERLKAANEVWPHMKPPWHPHMPGPEVAVAEAPALDGTRMSPEEDYGFEVKGYLIIRNVLEQDELEACNTMAERGKVPSFLTTHPVVINYIEQLCGLAFRIDKPIYMLEQIEGAAGQNLTAGNEPRNPMRGYFHQGNSRFCQGVRAVWSLSDSPTGGGGLILLPGSHTVHVPIPESVRSGEEDYLESIGMTLQPALNAGDLVLMAGSLAYGLRPWKNTSGPQQLAACEYVSVFARPSDFSSDSLTESGKKSEAAWMKTLDADERTIIGLNDTTTGPAAPVMSDGKTNRTDSSSVFGDQYYHPGIYDNHLSDPDAVDPLEFFYWELTGFLIVRNVMDKKWLQEANDVVNANIHKIDYKAAEAFKVSGSDKMAGTGRPGLPIAELDDEARRPFQKMLAHPALVHRLNWMLGGHFRAEGLGSVITTKKGGGGQILHGNGDPIYPNINWWPYLYQNGRCYTGQVNVAWQLHDVTEKEGGFVVVPGSHHARYPLPSNDSGDPAGHKGVLHPLMKAGDLLFFMGGATTHGAWAWHSDLDRRCVLNGYWSRDMARLGWVNNLEKG